MATLVADGLSIHEKRDGKGRSLVRSEMLIKGKTAKKVLKCLRDPKRDALTREYKVLQKFKDGTRIHYVRLGAPSTDGAHSSGAQDRDFVVQFSKGQTESGLFYYAKSV